MIEVIFLAILGLFYLIVASIQDFRTTIVFDWLNYSLVIFALGFRFFYSIFNEDMSFFYLGVIGFILFYLLGLLMYYGRLFAGADMKMFAALGAILPWKWDLILNSEILLFFLLFFFLGGAIYGLLCIFYLVVKNWKSFKIDFVKEYKKFRYFILAFSYFSILIMLLVSFNEVFFLLGIVLFLLPWVYLVSKSVDNSMIKLTSPRNLIEGDWLFEKVKVGKKFILPSWDGLSKENIALLKKHKKSVKIRNGVAFIPSFLLAYALFWIWFF